MKTSRRHATAALLSVACATLLLAVSCSNGSSADDEAAYDEWPGRPFTERIALKVARYAPKGATGKMLSISVDEHGDGACGWADYGYPGGPVPFQASVKGDPETGRLGFYVVGSGADWDSERDPEFFFVEQRKRVVDMCIKDGLFTSSEPPSTVGQIRGQEQ